MRKVKEKNSVKRLPFGIEISDEVGPGVILSARKDAILNRTEKKMTEDEIQKKGVVK